VGLEGRESRQGLSDVQEPDAYRGIVGMSLSFFAIVVSPLLHRVPFSSLRQCAVPRQQRVPVRRAVLGAQRRVDRAA
jgi:hypothetical protein